jgi:hypothetical protein
MMLDSDFIQADQQGQEEVLFDSGGTSDCYKLIKDNRIYCVKRPKPQHRQSEAYMGLFRKEFELGIDLEHPNIVRYFAYDNDEKGPFIRMDYVDGENLKEFVAQHPDYLNDKNNRKRFLDELFSAIAYVHEKGLLHLDLKPRNILITNKGHHVKLIDLGFGWSESFVNDLGYTRDYCAPEQMAARTKPLSPATDIYALGKVLQHFKLAKDSVIKRCLEEEPKDRFQSIAELEKAMLKSERSDKVRRLLLTLVVLMAIGAVVWCVKTGHLAPATTPSGVPIGAISGLFTINDLGDQVYFSKGNLQYKPSTKTWRFAEHQFDYVGTANENIGAEYDGWIDLFSWATSGYPHGASHYQPFSRPMRPSNCYAYGNPAYNLGDSTGRADWGYNAISNGGNREHLWRTPTSDEFRYLLNERETPSGYRYVKAVVDGVFGMIIFPDDWDSTLFQFEGVNSPIQHIESNSVDLTNWTDIIEAHGAVFLPASGIRDGTRMSVVGWYGFYWSSSHLDSTNALGMYCTYDTLFLDCITYRHGGRGVRLVRDK